MVDLLVDHARGDVAGHVGCCHLHGGRLKRAVVLLRTGLREAGTDVIFQRVQRIELGNILCELVVELGLDGLFDLVHLALEDGGLACKLLGAVVFGERDVHIALLTGDCADQCVFKAGDERAGAEREGVVLCLAALERLIVYEAFKVDDDGVAIGCCAVDGLDARVALCHAANLCVNLALFDLHLVLGHLKALVLAEGDLGVELSLDGQDNAALVGGVHVGNGRRADGLELLLNDSLRVDVRENFVHGVLIENGRTIHALDHLPRSLALAETGKHDIFSALGVRLVQRLLKFGLVDLDDNLGLAVFFFYALYIHVGFPPIRCGRF